MIVKISIVFVDFLDNFLVVREKVIPLHPLSRMNETSSKTRLRWCYDSIKERVL